MVYVIFDLERKRDEIKARESEVLMVLDMLGEVREGLGVGEVGDGVRRGEVLFP